VLVHCYAGMWRSTKILLSYLMAKNGSSPWKAFWHVKNKRSIVQPNATFCAELKLFELKLFGQSSQGRLHITDVLGYKALDWRNAIDSILDAALNKRRVVRNYGKYQLLWSRFKEVALGNTTELSNVLAYGLKSIGKLISQRLMPSLPQEAEAMVLSGLIKTIAMGMTYAHISRERFLKLVREALCCMSKGWEEYVAVERGAAWWFTHCFLQQFMKTTDEHHH
jgi:hypothetical protein